SPQIWDSTFSGATFSLGPCCSNDAVSAAGQMIPLPAGQFSSLRMLATAVNGSQASQSFKVTYSDGSSTTFTQSLSDWTAPQNFSGESNALTMPYRNLGTGAKDTRTVMLYGYSFPLNNAKTVSTIMLPNNSNVEVLGLTLAP